MIHELINANSFAKYEGLIIIDRYEIISSYAEIRHLEIYCFNCNYYNKLVSINYKTMDYI